MLHFQLAPSPILGCHPTQPTNHLFLYAFSSWVAHFIVQEECGGGALGQDWRVKSIGSLLLAYLASASAGCQESSCSRQHAACSTPHPPPTPHVLHVCHFSYFTPPCTTEWLYMAL